MSLLLKTFVSAMGAVLLTLASDSAVGQETSESLHVAVSSTNDSSNLVTVTLDEVPMVDVIRLFMSLSGVNFYVYEGVIDCDARVSASLTDVPWRPALRAILDQYGLGISPYGPPASNYWYIAKGSGAARETDPCAGPLESTNNTSGTMTATLDDVPLNLVLRAFIAVSGVNMVLEADVYSRTDNLGTTFSCEDAYWKDALRAILDKHNLELINVGPPGMDIWSVVWQPGYEPPPPPPPPDLGETFSGAMKSLGSLKNLDANGDGRFVAFSIMGLIFTLLLLLWFLVFSRRCRLLAIKRSNSYDPGERIWTGTLKRLMALAFILAYGTFIGAWLGLLVSVRVQSYAQFIKDGFVSALVFVPLCSLVLFAGYVAACGIAGRLRMDRSQRVSLLFYALLLIPLLHLCMDLRSPRESLSVDWVLLQNADANRSYQLLQEFDHNRLFEGEVERPWLSDHGWRTNILQHAEAIESAWAQIEEGRSLIERLDQCEVIIDVSPDGSQSRGISCQGALPPSCFCAHRVMFQVHQAYAMLRTEQGVPLDAARSLAKLQAVSMKAMRSSHTRLGRSLWAAVVKVNIDSVAWVMTHPNCTEEVLRELSEGFSAIPIDDTSQRRVIVSEAMFLEDSLATHAGREQFLGAMLEDNSWSLEHPSEPTGLLTRRLSSLALRLSFRPGRTRRDIVKWCQAYVDGASAEPISFRDADSYSEGYLKWPRIGNAAGWYLIMTQAEFFTVVNGCTVSAIRIKVRSDLLAAELDRRLGREPDLTDYYTGKPFADVDGGLVSMGPDKVLGTEDDIRLDSENW